MKIIKNEQGLDIELVLDKIKDYERFSLYQVSKIVDGVKVPLYKECYADSELFTVEKNGGKILSFTDSNMSSNLLEDLI